MEERQFLEKEVIPTDLMLQEALGSSYKYWISIKENLKNDYGDLIEEWKYYGKKYGWTLKLLMKKRNLFFFAPFKNYFAIAFVFGNKAVAEIEKSDLPEIIITEIKNAKKYMEGRGLRVIIKNKSDVNIIRKLVKLKINN